MNLKISKSGKLRGRLPVLTFAAIAAYLLWAEHQIHFIAYTPWILLIACLGMLILLFRIMRSEDLEGEVKIKSLTDGEPRQ